MTNEHIMEQMAERQYEERSRAEQLEDKYGSHDCTISPEDGCDCQEI